MKKKSKIEKLSDKLVEFLEDPFSAMTFTEISTDESRCYVYDKTGSLVTTGEGHPITRRYNKAQRINDFNGNGQMAVE
jgi:hypothetical protein